MKVISPSEGKYSLKATDNNGTPYCSLNIDIAQLFDHHMLQI